MATYTNTVVDGLTIGDLHHVKWVLAPGDSLGAALVISDTSKMSVSTRQADALTIGDSATTPWLSKAHDALTIGDQASISKQVERLVDALRVGDQSIQSIPQKVVDALTIGDATQVQLGRFVADALAISDQVSVSNPTVRFADALTIGDSVKIAYRFRVTDALTVGDDSKVHRTTFAKVVDALAEVDELSIDNPIKLTVLDALHISDAVSIAFSAINRVSDDLSIEDAAKGGGPGVAWSAHAEPMAMSRYTNFPFTSVAIVGGSLLATGPAGVYLLEGASDAGVNVDALVQHDLSDDVADDQGKMQTDPHFKRPRYAYASYKSDGVLRLRLGYVDENGDEQSADFDMAAQTANQYMTGRIDLGRGIRSRYLRPTLLNVDGAQFGSNDLKLIVDSVKRKI